MSMPCVFTVDVEDWYHILDTTATPPMEEWEHLPSRVEHNVYRLLSILNRFDVRSVFFFLGWIAERHPHLVRETADAGHEIASHGYSHELLYTMSRKQFAEDISRAKGILEATLGRPVHGYRATGFSITERTNWFFGELARCGHTYDSSVFPASRGHGGMKSAQLEPHLVHVEESTILEFPLSVKSVLGRRICFFGGGYLRLFPLRTIIRATDAVLSKGRPVVFYLHPREIDPEHPRLAMSVARRFKSYVGLRSVERKLNELFSRYEFVTFEDLSRRYLSGSSQHG